jgi:hypothetical protein
MDIIVVAILVVAYSFFVFLIGTVYGKFGKTDPTNWLSKHGCKKCRCKLQDMTIRPQEWDAWR